MSPLLSTTVMPRPSRIAYPIAQPIASPRTPNAIPASAPATLRMILGLAAPTSGRALVFDHPYAELPRASLRIGAVLEATDFHPGRDRSDPPKRLVNDSALTTAVIRVTDR
jgi:hypothetical protein